MDNKKIGLFIAELRKNKGLSQYDLAKKVYITRESVSKWERGLNKPSGSVLKQLSEILNVTPQEILLGQRLSSNSKEAQDLTISLYDENVKKGKIILWLIFVIFISIFSFLALYFINNYNSIHVFTINYSDDLVNISDGLLVTTKEKVYFQLGNISTDIPIQNLELYYIDQDDIKHLVFNTNSQNITLYDYYGYNSYFDVKNIKNIVKKLYLEISFIDDIKTVKLNVEENFANSDLINLEDPSISSNASINKFKLDSEKITNTFDCIDDNIYVYIDKLNNIEYIYNDTLSLLNVIQTINNHELKEWNYYINSNYIEYNQYNDDILINSYNFENNNFSCNIDNCNKNKNEIIYLINNLSVLLLD